MARAEWSFYGRGDELGRLISEVRQRRWFFGVISGRRRIGKTALIQQALKTAPEDGQRPLALLVTLPEGSTSAFIALFRNAIAHAGFAGRLNTSLDTLADLPAIAAAIGTLCASGVTVVLDEFQYCLRGPLRVLPSLLQMQVDSLQDSGASGGLIVMGSVQSEMRTLLEDRRMPLYGRETFRIWLGPWDMRTVFEVARKHGTDDPAHCLTLWTLFGGIPKYWRHVAEITDLSAVENWSEWTGALCTKLFLRDDSPLREEGETLFGRELRGVNRSMMQVLAERGPCAHSVLRAALPDVRSLGPYLKTMVQDLGLIEKEMPVFSDGSAKGARYAVTDPFLFTWLGVLQSACQVARIRPVGEVVSSILPKLQALEGYAFERMVRDLSEECSRRGVSDFPLTDRIRGYWNKPRNGTAAVEIDLVAWNDKERRVRLGSCKQNAGSHNPQALDSFRNHVERFLATRKGRRFRAWQRELVLYAPQFSEDQRRDLERDGWLCRDLTDFQQMLGADGSGQPGALAPSPKITGER